MLFIKDKSFYKTLLMIAIPIALQDLITFATSTMDTVMLGLADNTGTLLSASSLANQPIFLLFQFIFGISGAGVVLASQYWGKGDIPSIKKIISIIIKIVFFASIAVAVLVMIIPEAIMGLYTNDAEIIAKGADYLRIVGMGYVAFSVAQGFVCLIRSVEIVKISIIVNLAAFVSNTVLNYIFIFGKLGFEPMGIKGAAIATFISRVIQLIIVLVYVFAIDKKLKFRVRDLFTFDKTLFKDLARYGSPVVLNEIMWGLAISVQAAVIGHIDYLGGDAVAANSIAGIVQQIALIFIIGIANAATVVVGKSVGMNEGQKTIDKSKTLRNLSVIIGVFCCGLMLLFKDLAVGFYNFDEATINIAKDIIVAISFVTIFCAHNCMTVMGVLRGGGDTKFCLILETTTLWLCAVPLAFLTGVVFKAPIIVVMLSMKTDEYLKFIGTTIRLHGKKWIKSIARDFDENKA